MERVHPAVYLDALERFCVGGGGRIDEDTRASAESWDAASLAAGAGVAAIEVLDQGTVEAAFCAVRPPGHHAETDAADRAWQHEAMLVNAAAQRDRLNPGGHFVAPGSAMHK
jgi:acetoin utilization deacetylase AcuC-like enzyme